VHLAKYLHECLASIASQTRPPDQILVVDDGSPDREMVRRAVESCTRKVTLVTQSNEGAAVARNRGIIRARTSWVAFLDADDYWYPELLERQLALLRSTGCSLACANADIIGDSPLTGRRFMEMPSQGQVSLRSLLDQKCTVLTSTVIAKRDVLFEAGLFDPQLRRGQDFDLWLRLAHRGLRFAYSAEALAAQRVYDDSLSGSMTPEIQRALTVLEKVRQTLTLAPSERALVDARITYLQASLARESGKAHLVSADFTGARTAFAAAAGAVPAWKLAALQLGLRVAPHVIRRAYLRNGHLHQPEPMRHTSAEPA
jgi:glycosyltransferase involved in cell wall biosynthesis